MSRTHKCDGCDAITPKPALHIERTDGWDGGGGIRVTQSQPWDLCKPCAQALDQALGKLRVAAASGAAR